MSASISRVVVSAPCGRLAGTTDGTVQRFLGVPYAASAAGEGRYRLPLPHPAWRGERDATEPGPAALQWGHGTSFGTLFGTLRRRQSEDCLYLNVWAPARSERPLPVLVWVHGGAFIAGAGSTFLYEGSRLAVDGQMVVVTLNYRLGPLGFLDLGRVAPAAGIPANLGLHDQLAALEWVRANIAAFGGDPACLTLCGESAGAMSVGALLPRAHGRFERAVLQSGAAANVSQPDEAALVAEEFLWRLELSPAAAHRVRSLPVGRLMAAGLLSKVRPWAGFLPWQPSVDGQLIDRQPLAALAAGEASEVPVLIGTNRDEWRLFGPLERFYPMTWQRLRKHLAASRRGRDSSAEELEQLLVVYRGAGRRRPLNPARTFDRFRTDEAFRVPAIELATTQSHHAPVYVYRFDYRLPLVGWYHGACHGAEIPLLFGSDRHPVLQPIYLRRRAGDALGLQMRRSWGAFARCGDPGTPEPPEWRPFDPDVRPVTLLADPPRLVECPDRELDAIWWPAGPVAGGSVEREADPRSG